MVVRRNVGFTRFLSVTDSGLARNVNWGHSLSFLLLSSLFSFFRFFFSSLLFSSPSFFSSLFFLSLLLEIGLLKSSSNVWGALWASPTGLAKPQPKSNLELWNMRSGGNNFSYFCQNKPTKLANLVQFKCVLILSGELGEELGPLCPSDYAPLDTERVFGAVHSGISKETHIATRNQWCAANTRHGSALIIDSRFEPITSAGVIAWTKAKRCIRPCHPRVLISHAITHTRSIEFM